MTITFQSFDRPVRAAIFGAGGGIGSAMLDQLAQSGSVEAVHAFSRRPVNKGEKIEYHPFRSETDSDVEDSIQVLKGENINLCVITIGTLHGDDFGPEKAIRDLETDVFQKVIRTNTLLPALIAKSMYQIMPKDQRTITAAFSARVGSISDNRIGGWHSYRASKAALNQLFRNYAIESGRRNQEAVVVTLHPGTVDTALSEPFQKNVPEGKLFTPEYSVRKLLEVLDSRTPADSGRCFDYAGLEVKP